MSDVSLLRLVECPKCKTEGSLHSHGRTITNQPKVICRAEGCERASQGAQLAQAITNAKQFLTELIKQKNSTDLQHPTDQTPEVEELLKVAPTMDEQRLRDMLATLKRQLIRSRNSEEQAVAVAKGQQEELDFMRNEQRDKEELHSNLQEANSKIQELQAELDSVRADANKAMGDLQTKVSELEECNRALVYEKHGTRNTPLRRAGQERVQRVTTIASDGASDREMASNKDSNPPGSQNETVRT